MKATVVNLKNKNVGDVELDEAIFAIKGGTGAIYDMVKMQFAKKHKGTASTRNHAMVSGTTAKMYRQKGTGRARHGDYRTNIFVGGGKSFGPHPRDYSYTMPKKAKKRAMRAALSQKVRDGKLIVVEEFTMPEIKTKAFVQMMKDLGVSEALVVLHEANEAVWKSAHNVPKAKVLRWEGLNVADMIRFEHTVLTKQALEKVQEVLKP